jgi:hypothetical protein
VVGRELVQEDDRRPASCLFIVKTSAFLGDGVGHFGFLSIFLFSRNFLAQPADKIAVNSRGGNAAVWLHFRHRMIAESPRNRFRSAT